MSKLFSFSLFFVSFTPLWVSVLFIDFKSVLENRTDIRTEIIGICCIIIMMCISLYIIKGKLHNAEREGSIHFIVRKAKEEKTITAEYLLSYILPLFAFDFTLWNEVVLFLLFFLTIGFLCIKHNYFSVNIILEIFKYRFYICKLENDDGIEIEQTIISKRNLVGCIGDSIYLKSLNDEYKLDVQ